MEINTAKFIGLLKYVQDAMAETNDDDSREKFHHIATEMCDLVPGSINETT